MNTRSAVSPEFDAEQCDDSVIDRLRLVAQALPEAAALSGDGVEPMTFAELIAQVDAAGARVAALDGSVGDRIAVLLHHEPSAIVAQLAVLAAGRVAVPFDHLAPPAELSSFLDSADLSQVIVSADLRDLLERSGFSGPVLEWESLADLPQGDLVQVDGLAPAYLLFSSGSSGAPKGVTTLHSAMVRAAREMGTNGFLAPDDRVALAAPLPFMAAVDMALWTLMCGAELCLFSVRERGPVAFTEWLADEQITIWGTATAALRGMASMLGDRPLPALRLVMVGGEVMYFEDLGPVRSMSQVGLDVMSVYASTEIPLVAWNLIEHDRGIDSQGALGIGRPVEGTLVSLEAMESDDPDRGEIVLDCPIGSLGYWRRPDLLDRFEFDEVSGRMRFHTSDIGRRRDDGGIEIVGRVDSMVRVRGYQVHLSMVEGALRADPRVGNAAVLALPEENGGVTLVAHVCGVGDGDKPDAKAVRTTMRQSLPAYMVPARIISHESIPMTSRGKADRVLLEKLSEPEEREAGRPPRNSTEQKVLEIWQAVLGRDDFGVDEDFFDIGGDSLSATEFLLRLERAFGVWQPLSSWLEATTVEAIAASVVASREGRLRRLNLIQPGDPSRPPLVVVYDLHGGAFRFRELARSMGEDQEVWGLDNPMLDGHGDMPRTIEQLADMHVADLLEQFGEAPINLVGYSGSGTYVAFEIARQLLGAGGSVGFLCLIDFGPVHLRHGGRPRSYRPPGAWPNRPRSDLPLSKQVLEAVDQVRGAPRGQRLSRLSRLLDVARPYDLALARIDTARRGRIRPELRTAAMWYRVMDALVDYEFEPIDAQAFLLVSDQTAKGNIAVDRRLDYGSLTESTMGWAGLLRGGLTILDVVGPHNDLLEPPYVDGVGQGVREGFDLWLKQQHDDAGG